MTPEHQDIRLTYRWQPSIRILLVDAKQREYEFPYVGQWLAEQHNLFETDGVLSRAQCRALWRWLKREDKPPTKLWIMFNREDIMRAFPAEDAA